MRYTTLLIVVQLLLVAVVNSDYIEFRYCSITPCYFSNPNNWYGGRVPGPGDTVSINYLGNPLTLDSDVTVASFTVSYYGEIIIGAGVTLTTGYFSGSVVSGDGTLVITRTVNSGTFRIKNVILRGPVDFSSGSTFSFNRLSIEDSVSASYSTVSLSATNLTVSGTTTFTQSFTLYVGTLDCTGRCTIACPFYISSFSSTLNNVVFSTGATLRFTGGEVIPFSINGALNVVVTQRNLTLPSFHLSGNQSQVIISADSSLSSGYVFVDIKNAFKYDPSTLGVSFVGRMFAVFYAWDQDLPITVSTTSAIFIVPSGANVLRVAPTSTGTIAFADTIYYAQTSQSTIYVAAGTNLQLAGGSSAAKVDVDDYGTLTLVSAQPTYITGDLDLSLQSVVDFKSVVLGQPYVLQVGSASISGKLKYNPVKKATGFYKLIFGDVSGAFADMSFVESIKEYMVYQGTFVYVSVEQTAANRDASSEDSSLKKVDDNSTIELGILGAVLAVVVVILIVVVVAAVILVRRKNNNNNTHKNGENKEEEKKKATTVGAATEMQNV